jgi:hypothetical protein
VKVPFTPGRMDTSQEQTDVESLAPPAMLSGGRQLATDRLNAVLSGLPDFQWECCHGRREVIARTPDEPGARAQHPMGETRSKRIRWRPSPL